MKLEVTGIETIELTDPQGLCFDPGPVAPASLPYPLTSNHPLKVYTGGQPHLTPHWGDQTKWTGRPPDTGSSAKWQEGWKSKSTMANAGQEQDPFTIAPGEKDLKPW